MMPGFITRALLTKVRCVPLGRQLHFSAPCGAYNLTSNISDCYYVLRVAENCDDQELRDAYLKLAKEYHPDSASKTADARKFAQVGEAYKTVINHRAKKDENKKSEGEVNEEAMFDIRHTAPQHRQYLTYDGKGFGSPSQRERQYKSYKLDQATDNIYDYKIKRIVHQYESALVTRDKQATRKRTIRNAMDRLVEDLIQESMAKGEFDNLSGKGKPLQNSDLNPHIDTFTTNLNKILITNGYAPQWITLEKEIRSEIQEARERLKLGRIKTGPEPLPPSLVKKWRECEKEFIDTVKLINKKVDKLNMVVPSMNQQIIPFNIGKEISKVLDYYRQLIDNGELAAILERINQVEPPSGPPVFEKTSFKTVWSDIRALFSSS